MANGTHQVVHGIPVPALCYGTAWKEDRTEALVRLALDTGFRAIDTANQRKHYVEAGVGAAIAGAIRDGVVTRGELFLQTKFTYARGQDHRLPYDPEASVTEQVAQSFASSLEHLQTTYLDSYLLHGPATSRGLADADVEVWRAMEAQHRAGTVKLLGISNVALDQLEQLVTLARVPVAFVQNRCYARDRWDADLRAFCRSRGIVYQGFSLLTANRAELQSKAPSSSGPRQSKAPSSSGPRQSGTMSEIALRLGCTREQVVFAFARQVGMLPLTGTTSVQHMRQDLASQDVELADRDIEAIETLAVE
ncbi:MAG: aldo/keto reductase [Myxococcota bacterium]|nr:aldo/keto reductase [Myxococcota bacterium]